MLAAIGPLLVLHATLIAVKTSDAICPSTREVSEAIASRMPGLLVPSEPGTSADTLVLALSLDPVTGTHVFTLVDRDDHVRLRRELPPPATAGQSDCPALAETVALMVERYLQDLAYHGESIASPERRRWELFAGATWRPGADGLSAYEVRAGISRLLGRRLVLALVAGAEGASQQEWPGAIGNLRRFPLDVRLLWRAAIGPTTLELGPFAGAQLLVLQSRSGDRTASDAQVTPTAGFVAGLRMPLGRTAFLRAVASVGVAVFRYDFVTADPRQTVQFGTERIWDKMGIEAGFAFW